MAFNVQENAILIQEFSTTKNLPTVGRNTLPRSVALLPRFGPHWQILAAPLSLA